MQLKPLPSETDPPGSLMGDLVALRNKALGPEPDFNTAVLLSHVHSWLHWLNENFEALKEIQHGQRTP